MLAVVSHKFKLRKQINLTDVWVYGSGSGERSGES